MLFTGSSYPLANQYSMSVFWANLMSKKIPIVLHLTILLMLLFFGLPAAKAQQRRQVIIDHAGEMRNLKKDGREVRRLIGDVIMRHEDITMKCDSAYEYVGENRFDAYGRVVIVQEDSRLYGDSLHYDGNKKVGRVRGKLVRLVDKDAELITNYLDFNTRENSATFYNGGIMTSDDSKFSCRRGIYFSRRKQAIFSGSVAYETPEMLLNTDSLIYYTDQELAQFFGPTRIYNDDNFIYCEKGWHNRETEESEFTHDAYVDNGKQQVYGHRIVSSQQTGFAQITGRGCVVDSTRNLRIFGDTINYYRNEKYAEVRCNPFIFSVSDDGDSLYLKADLFTAITVDDTLSADSSHIIFYAYRNVAFFRNDFQGVCDSMVFHGGDSILHMYNKPVLWNDDNQLSASYISFAIRNQLIDRMYMTGSSFVCSQEDTAQFNQIKGKDMLGYFNKGRLYKLDVEGNAETVYFARDKGVLSAVNRAEGSRLTINLKKNKVTSIMFKEKPQATLFPIDKAEIEDIFIKGFIWQNEKRPAIIDVVPKGIDIDFFSDYYSKANAFRNRKTKPAESLNEQF